ncbi:uncharacterized protein TRAVEDRAFT_54474 [Trametes versicolor FP-101664 SS1]|uniref:F-box domain-containing protein n=1 Tax=Trametes versicolor (strain FP-101664) TaxID=717944 RepID=R7S6G0_TRAVS|nr:uncharacterized protein TRAVEDRAFT_54474 [Trametes versicolor FP-101664 SS1]EIW51538.1 hypothetical protein TRAVEDRAFT_54474 [Trametes versicolor FP-101664 SS1]
MPFPHPFKRSRQQEPAAFPRSILDAVKAFYATERREPQYKPKPRDDRKSAAHSSRHPHPPPHHAPPARTRAPARRAHRITQLPNEVLAHIFVLGAEEDAMFPVAVSHVCRAWRYIALHTPALWRRITLDAGSLAMWGQRIPRAKAVPLDVQLAPLAALSHLAYYNHVQLCMHVVLPYIHRWRSLEVRFGGYAPFLWNAALGGCCGHSAAIEAPALRDLTLVYPENDDTKEYMLFNGYAPRLRRATIQGIRLAWSPSLFQNLTYLDYTHHGFTRGAQAASEVLYMLQVSATLEELRLSFPWRGDLASRYALSASFSRTVHLPRLRKLALHVDGPDIPPALTYTLPHLSLPVLRSLYLISHPAPKSVPYTDVSFPHLRTVLKALPRLPALSLLHVAHGWLEERFLASLLTLLPYPGAPHLTLTLEGPQITHGFLCYALRGAGRKLRGLATVRAERLTAEGILDVLNRLNGMLLQSATHVSSLSALYIRDCAGLDWRSLQWLSTVGVTLRVWEGGREVDLRHSRATKRARFP